MTAPRTSVVTDWRVRDEEKLPDLRPGETFERLIAPQKFIVLHQIVVRGPSLIKLGIGAIPEIPFEEVPPLKLGGADNVRRYRPRGLYDDTIKKSLVKIGAAAAGENAIAIAPGLEVVLLLRNDGTALVKPRATIVVQEES